MTDLPFRSATQLAQAIRDREISSLELTDLYIERIQKYDEALNAVVVRCFDQAREAARAADQLLGHGRSLRPLHGLPITVKEAYNLEGAPTTWGVPELRDNVAAGDGAPAQGRGHAVSGSDLLFRGRRRARHEGIV